MDGQYCVSRVFSPTPPPRRARGNLGAACLAARSVAHTGGHEELFLVGRVVVLFSASLLPGGVREITCFFSVPLRRVLVFLLSDTS